MRWKVLIFTGILLIIFGISFYIISSSNNPEEIENEEGLEEASPSIVETSQSKLKSISGQIGENGTIDQKIVILEYNENMTSESLVLVRDGEFLNLNQSIHDVFGERIFERNLNNYLRRGFFTNQNQERIIYEQKIEFQDEIYLSKFKDKEYLGNNEEYLGIIIPKDTLFMNYTLSFVNDVTWDMLEGSLIKFLGRDYYVIYSSSSDDTIKLFEKPIRVNLKEGEITRIVHPAFLTKELIISSIKTDKFKLDINGQIIEDLVEGKDYVYSDVNFYIEEIAYSDKGASTVKIVLSPKVLTLTPGEVIIDNETINGLSAEFYPASGEDLERLYISWRITDKTFLTRIRPLVLPYFSNLNFTLGKSSYDDKDREYADVTLTTNVYSTSF